MKLILIFLATLIAETWGEESRVFYTGFMEFNTEDSSQIHQIGKVNKPVSILSLTSLAYSNSFALRTTRKQFKSNKQYFFQVNCTSINNNDPYFVFSTTIQYVITRQLDNMQIYTFNLTSKKPAGTVKPKRLSINKSRCIVFPLGFSNSSYVSKFSVRQSQFTKFVIYAAAMINETTSVWIQVQVVVVQEKFTNCGPIGVSQSTLNLHNPLYQHNRPETKPEYLDEPIHKKPGYEYLMGIQQLAHGSEGNIFNDLDKSILNLTQKGFKYAVIPMNMTCFYVKQNNGHSVVFIVFFSIFTGIFGVVLITFLAYCVIKQCERRRKMNSSQIVLNPSVGANELPSDKDMPNDVVIQALNPPQQVSSSESYTDGTERKLALALAGGSTGSATTEQSSHGENKDEKEEADK